MAPSARRALNWLTAHPVAHRGLHGLDSDSIENTESAVQAALDGGYAIEVDLQLTAEGEAVVFHDYALDRLMEGTGLLIDHTVRQLKNLSFQACADRIQTLGELLEQVAGQSALMLELKSRWTGVGPLERRVAELLSAYRGPVSVMSFDPDSMAVMKRIAPHLIRGLVSERFPPGGDWRFLPLAHRLSLRRGDRLPDCDPHFLHYHVEGLPFAPTRLFRALGRPILAWTVRTAAQRKRAATYADQMIFEGFRP